MLIPNVLEGAGLKYADVMARADLRAQADRELSRRSLGGIFAYFVVWAIIFVTTELEHANEGVLELLGVLLAVAAVGRLYLVLNFKKLHALNPRRWRGLFCAGTIISAGIWGGVGGLAINFDGLGTTAVMVMLPTAGIAAGGVVSLAPARRLGMIFLSALLLPPLAVAAWGESVAERGIAVLLLSFFIAMLIMWRKLHLDYWIALANSNELIRAKEDAEAAALAKGQFIASVSHELRTPLTSVIGALGMIAEYPPDGMPTEAIVLVDMAYRNGKRLSILVNDILDFEKLDAHRMQFNFQPVELTSFLNHVIDLNELYSDRYQVTFILQPPPAGLTVVADENRLMQVMTNLLSNAAKHSRPQTSVRITVRKTADAVRVSVMDHGPGVPDEFKPHIFERFAQAQEGQRGKKEGTGLGLAISKAIIEQMGGTIGFDSVFGQGATFWFELPRAENAADTRSNPN